MNVYLIGLIIIFAIFIVILIMNPNVSCFGKKIKSPFYPLLRKRKKKSSRSQGKNVDDYDFFLVDEKSRRKSRITNIEPRERRKPRVEPKTNDYGFSLSDRKKKDGKK